MSPYYVIHDYDPALKAKYGSKNVPESELREWNQKGFGVHFTPNDFEGSRRASNLVRINFWIADIDEGTKPEQMSKIRKLPIHPTRIVETKRGYHCYWKALDATAENYRKIEEGIIRLLGADPQCKDVCHTLRAPGYYHLKDPKSPFLVRVVEQNDYVAWKEKQMLLAFTSRPKPKPKAYVPPPPVGAKELVDPANWERYFHVSRIGPGNRNAEFARIAMWLRDSGCDRYNAESTIEGINRMLVDPLPEREVRNLIGYHFKRKEN